MGVVLPQIADTELRIAFPIMLPMGWNKSPPFFCTFTETAAVLSNHLLHHTWSIPQHALEPVVNKQQPTRIMMLAFMAPYNICPPLEPMKYIDINIDDYIGVEQQPDNAKHIFCTVLHTILDIFHPNDQTPDINSNFGKQACQGQH